MATNGPGADILKLPIVGREGVTQVATIPLATIRTAAANLMELTVEFDMEGHFVACRYVQPQLLAAPRAAGISR